MMYFHNQALTYPGYGLTFDQLLDAAGGGGIKTSIFLEGFGFAVEQVGLNAGKLQTAMEALADNGGGRLPANQSAFFKALSNEAQNISWVSATPSIVLGVATDVIKGVAAGGESVITTLKSLNVIFPIMIVGAVIYIFVQKVKKAA